MPSHQKKQLKLHQSLYLSQHHQDDREYQENRDDRTYHTPLSPSLSCTQKSKQQLLPLHLQTSTRDQSSSSFSPSDPKRPLDPSESNTWAYRDILFQDDWSIPQRLTVFLFGVGCYFLSSLNKGRIKFILRGLAGASLIRSLFNLHVTALLGRFFNPSMTLTRELAVKAPLGDVFLFLKTFANYPRFMSFVKRVEINERGNLTWTLQGPFGLTLEFDSHLEQLIPNQKISWISAPHAVIRNSGSITLSEDLSSLTHLKIELSYAPPFGVLGYLLLHLTGYNPKRRIQADLDQLKRLLEEGTPFSPPLQDEIA